MKKRFLISFVVFLTGFSALQIFAQNMGAETKEINPENVIRQYIENDLFGARLSGKTWKEKIYPLYFDKQIDEPSWDTFTVAKDFRIINTSVKKEKAIVKVKYNIMCDVNVIVSTNSKTNPIVEYSLTKVNGNWKVDGYMTSPIVSQTTAIQRISSLIKKSKNNKESEIKYQSLLRDLQNLNKGVNQK